MTDWDRWIETLEDSNDAMELVDAYLHVAGIPFVREWRFHPVRRWRFDFAIFENYAIEVEGGQFTGGHKRGRAADTDCEKFNEATILGWRVLRFTTGQVVRGEAFPVIQQLWQSHLH